ncbi:MAG TPA: SEC-C metal-binding domain-containing protein [Elusimicrobiota bacterium]|nr:SEC-C metal-binding domain-containing protein [Elusimicrobiota bacterium]
MAFGKILSKLTPAKGEMAGTLGRNDPCHCGSGKKYKKCHLPQDEEAERKQLAKAEIPPKPPESEKPGAKPPHDKHPESGRPAHEKSGGGFMRSIFNRKTGGG